MLNESQVGNAINLGGFQGLCRYNYAYFDNVQEEQKNLNFGWNSMVK